MKRLLSTLIVVSTIVIGLQANSSPAYASTITVTTNIDELNTDGDCSLREAIQAANKNIVVDACLAGSNTVTDIVNIGSLQIVITKTPSGENANAGGDFDILNNTAANDLTLKGTTTGSIDGNNFDRIIHVQPSATMRIENIRLTKGRAGVGGGIYNQGTLTLDKVKVQNSVASSAMLGDGGGILNQGTLTVQNDSLLSANDAVQQGSGIMNSTNSTLIFKDSKITNSLEADRGTAIYNAGTMTLQNSRITGSQGSQAIRNTHIANIRNTVISTSASFGIMNDAIMTLESGSSILSSGRTGLFNNSNGNVVIDNSSIRNNTSMYEAAGIQNQGTITIQNNSVIEGNVGVDVNGGGIVNNGTMTIDKSTVRNNSAQNAGGIQNGANLTIRNNSVIEGNDAIYGGSGIFNQGTLIIDKSIVRNNLDVESGGGIYNAANLTIRNLSVISGNTASNSGAGIYNNQGTLSIQNSSLLNNSTNGNGGGLYSTAPATMGTNSIIQGNSASVGGGIYIADSTLTATSILLLDNIAVNGGAVYVNRNVNFAVSVTNSCVVNNSNTAFYNGNGLYTQNASSNWWGASDGPSGVGPGSGNSVGNGIDYSSFKTSAILGCPNQINPTATPTFTPAATLTYTPTYTPSDTPTDTPTFTPSDTPTPSDTFTPTETPTETFTPSDTYTPSDTFTPSDTPTITDTPTETFTPSDTYTPTITYTPSNTFTPFFTPTLPHTPTNTLTDTPTASATFTPTLPHTPTDTLTDTPTASATFTPTDTLTPCVSVAGAPTLISPVHRTHMTDTTPSFAWSSVTGALSYRLMVYLEDRSFEYKKRVFVTNYTLTSAEVLTPAKYLWRVRTQDQLCSTWSTWSTRNTLFVD